MVPFPPREIVQWMRLADFNYERTSQTEMNTVFWQKILDDIQEGSYNFLGQELPATQRLATTLYNKFLSLFHGNAKVVDEYMTLIAQPPFALEGRMLYVFGKIMAKNFIDPNIVVDFLDENYVEERKSPVGEESEGIGREKAIVGVAGCPIPKSIPDVAAEADDVSLQNADLSRSVEDESDSGNDIADSSEEEPESQRSVPRICVTTNGTVGILLLHDVLVEMTVDKALRVLVPGQFAAAINGRGSASCVMHQSGHIFQNEGLKTSPAFAADVRDFLRRPGIAFSKKNECHAFVILSANGPEGRATTPISQLASDFTKTIFYDESRVGGKFVSECEEIVAKAVYTEAPDKAIALEINGFEIKQTSDGALDVEAKPRRIRINQESELLVKTHFVHIFVSDAGQSFIEACEVANRIPQIFGAKAQMTENVSPANEESIISEGPNGRIESAKDADPSAVVEPKSVKVPNYPRVFITTNGTIGILLLHNVLVETTVDKALRVLVPGQFAVALDGLGKAAVVIQSSGKIIKTYAAEFSIGLTEDVQAIVDPPGIVFAKKDQANVFVTSQEERLEGTDPIPLNQFTFPQLAIDFTLNLFDDHSQFGEDFIPDCKDIVSKAVFTVASDKSIALEINGFEIRQSSDGVVDVEAKPRRIRINPMRKSELLVKTHFVEMLVSDSGEAKLKPLEVAKPSPETVPAEGKIEDRSRPTVDNSIAHRFLDVCQAFNSGCVEAHTKSYITVERLAADAKLPMGQL